MFDTISGIQSRGVQANAKHFIGNEQETHREFATGPDGSVVPPISSNIDDRTTHEVYLWPFAESVRAGVASVMCSYNRLNGTGACENDAALNAILKEELAFQGYVSFLVDVLDTIVGFPNFDARSCQIGLQPILAYRPCWAV